MLHQQQNSHQSLKHPTKLKTAGTRQMWPIYLTGKRKGTGVREEAAKGNAKNNHNKTNRRQNGPKQIPLAESKKIRKE